MVTGDNKHVAYQVAESVGIALEDVVYSATPEDKLRIV